MFLTDEECAHCLQLANKLFDVTIEAADGEVPVWNKDVRFFLLKSGGKPKANFYFGEIFTHLSTFQTPYRNNSRDCSSKHSNSVTGPTHFSDIAKLDNRHQTATSDHLLIDTICNCFCHEPITNTKRCSLADPYSRPSEKRGGAWMDEVVGQSGLLAPPGQAVRLPCAHMVCNQSPPIGDKPSLMTFRCQQKSCLLLSPNTDNFTLPRTFIRSLTRASAQKLL